MTESKYKGATIVRAPHEDNYFRMKRQTAQDKDLSFEARGMIAYILSKKDGWEMQVHDLQQNCAKGRVYRILDELAERGYLEKRSKSRVNGRWEWSPYILHELPYPQKQDTEKQDTENADIKQITELEITDKEKELSAPEPAQGESTSEMKKDSLQDKSDKQEQPKLTSIEYDAYILILNRKFQLNGGRVHDVYHQLRGSIAAKKKKTARYEYGQLFRDKPVSLTELQGFLGYYETVCLGCTYPISADGLEDWFGKYRQSKIEQANRPPTLFQQKLPTNYATLDRG